MFTTSTVNQILSGPCWCCHGNYIVINEFFIDGTTHKEEYINRWSIIILKVMFLLAEKKSPNTLCEYLRFLFAKLPMWLIDYQNNGWLIICWSTTHFTSKCKITSIISRWWLTVLGKYHFHILIKVSRFTLSSIIHQTHFDKLWNVSHFGHNLFCFRLREPWRHEGKKTLTTLPSFLKSCICFVFIATEGTQCKTVSSISDT